MTSQHVHHDHQQDDEIDHDHALPTAPVKAGLIKRFMLKAIELYQMTSPARTPRCRYLPTCSAYAAEAIEVHGAGRGLWLAIKRLGRCQPFGSSGFDPVPEK